jgi:hypothetical protein
MTLRELLALPASARQTVLEVVLEHHPELKPEE